MENLNWSELGFGYIRTDYNIRCYYRNGKWGELEVCSSEILNIHMAATCLHYGQESFEGLKASAEKTERFVSFVWMRMQNVCNLPVEELKWQNCQLNSLKKQSAKS